MELSKQEPEPRQLRPVEARWSWQDKLQRHKQDIGALPANSDGLGVLQLPDLLLLSAKLHGSYFLLWN